MLIAEVAYQFFYGYIVELLLQHDQVKLLQMQNQKKKVIIQFNEIKIYDNISFRWCNECTRIVACDSVSGTDHYRSN